MNEHTITSELLALPIIVGVLCVAGLLALVFTIARAMRKGE